MKNSEYVLITYRNGDTIDFFNFDNINDVNNYEINDNVDKTRLFKLNDSKDGRNLIEEKRY